MPSAQFYFRAERESFIAAEPQFYFRAERESFIACFASSFIFPWAEKFYCTFSAVLLLALQAVLFFRGRKSFIAGQKVRIDYS